MSTVQRHPAQCKVSMRIWKEFVQAMLLTSTCKWLMMVHLIKQAIRTYGWQESRMKLTTIHFTRCQKPLMDCWGCKGCDVFVKLPPCWEKAVALREQFRNSPVILSSADCQGSSYSRGSRRAVVNNGANNFAWELSWLDKNTRFVDQESTVNLNDISSAEAIQCKRRIITKQLVLHAPEFRFGWNHWISWVSQLQPLTPFLLTQWDRSAYQTHLIDQWEQL